MMVKVAVPEKFKLRIVPNVRTVYLVVNRRFIT